MGELPVLLAYFFACCAIVVVPGPTVTVIIANSLRAGSWAGLANVAGTQAGLLVMIALLSFGLEWLIESLSHIFIYLKLAGATYLVWLGVKMLRSSGTLGKPDPQTPLKSLSGYFWQGVLVIWSNPKALVFFGAFIPQFIDPKGSAAFQVMMLGLIFMAVATVFDSLYALAAGKTGKLLTHRKIRFVECLSGGFLIGGGIWLALSRRI